MKVENEMALPITKSVTVMLLEPYAGKLARTVLRGESSRKGADLLDSFLNCGVPVCVWSARWNVPHPLRSRNRRLNLSLSLSLNLNLNPNPNPNPNRS